MPNLLDLAYAIAAIFYLPLLLHQMLVLKKNRRGWRQRLGGVPARTGSRPCIWVHAVSLGEVNATRGLVAQIRQRWPDSEVFVSATTDTGYAAACGLYGSERVFRYPLDFSFAVRRTLDRIRPRAIVLMELEVWPNLLELAAARGIPVCIANGRVTEEKSMRRLRMPIIRPIARRMFRRITFVAAQNETYGGRFLELGVPPDRIHVTGNMKYDTAVVADSAPGDADLAAAMGIDRARPLIVAGSTGPGEEEMLLEAYARLRAERPQVQLALIPRKPERFEEVARLIEARGFACVRRGRQPDGSSAPSSASEPDRPAVFLGDTMGELRKFYSLADVVFVGRTLVPLGGSDVMEVAGLGRAMCLGPHVENFADAVASLLSARAAVQVQSARALPSELGRLLDQPAEARAMGRRARDVVRANIGATARTLDLLAPLLDPAPSMAASAQ